MLALLLSTLALAPREAHTRGASRSVAGQAWGGQYQKLVPSDPGNGDYFGCSVSISGDIAIVGAFAKQIGSNPYQGAAYVFVKNGATWTQQQELIASDGATDDEFGTSVSISGTTAIVGAPGKAFFGSGQGYAYVFVQNGSTWTQQAELRASDGAAHDNFGDSVSISGTTAVIGANGKTVGSNAGQGVAYVFVQTGTTWSQQQELVAPDPLLGDNFGVSVSVSGTTLLVGADQLSQQATKLGQGKAYVFVQGGTSWTVQQELVAADGVAVDHYGTDVSISGATAVVGAAWHQVGTNAQEGVVYVYARSGATWTQQQEISPFDGRTQTIFGRSVAISGASMVVGATYGINLQTPAAYFFVQNGSSWAPEELPNPGGTALNSFGYASTIDGSIGIISAPTDGAGSAFVFEQGTVGAPCAGPSGCPFGYCVDGVCCNSPCGGGVSEDCQACSVAAGGPVDGTCSPSNAGFVCGSGSSATCTVPATCDGMRMTCLSNAPSPAGTVCNMATECTFQSVCDGMNQSCPPEALRGNGTACTGGVCSGNTCVSCGAHGEPCCAGNVCTTPQTCGGGGTAGVCGCKPVTCPASYPCGAVPDGCGGMAACGSCGPGQTCVGNQCEMVDADAGVKVGDAGSDAAAEAGTTGSPEAGSDASTDTGSLEADATSEASDAGGHGTATGQSGGCGCRLAGRQDDRGLGLFWLGFVGLVGLRRRRSAREESRRPGE